MQHISESLAAHRRNFTPAYLLEYVYGIVPGEWACPACGLVVEEQHYPASRCPSCRRPFPRRCLTPGCLTVTEPEFFDGTWYERTPSCPACQRRTAVEAADAHFERAMTDYEDLVAFAREYWPALPDRAALDRSLRDWLSNQCGTADGRTMLLAMGGNGTGKSTAMVRAAMVALQRGLVSGMVYLTETEAHRAASDWWSDDSGRKSEARRTLQRAAEARLLVLDELGRNPGPTDAQKDRIEELLGTRLDRRRPTLVGSNNNLSRHPRGVLGHLSPALASRFAQRGVAVICDGEDMRRK